MPARILVAYATLKGSTAEIARAIGDELQTAGHNADVEPMKTITSLEGYDAVIIGAPVYMGKVIDVKKFVDKHRDALSTVRVAAFAVGVAPTSDDPKAVTDCLDTLHAALEPLQPLASTMFAGKLDPGKLSFFEKRIWGMVKGPEGDFRDWGT
ncbi:MAG TPA: flavodoxin, partial [Methanolinea sp.]|nr:flavodoxin [Methanolinea sp.]